MNQEPWRLRQPVEEEESEAQRWRRALEHINHMLQQLAAERHLLTKEHDPSGETSKRLTAIGWEEHELHGLRADAQRRLRTMGDRVLG
jgi:hypothetical protein